MERVPKTQPVVSGDGGFQCAGHAISLTLVWIHSSNSADSVPFLEVADSFFFGLGKVKFDGGVWFGFVFPSSARPENILRPVCG